MFKKIFLLWVVLLFVSCRQISSIPSRILSSEDNIKIIVNLEADGTINPGYESQGAQPVKSCIFIVKSKFWAPNSAYAGAPCNEMAANSGEVVEYKELMVSPNKSYKIEFDLVYNKKDKGSLWVLMGANFQQINDAKSIDKAEIKKKSKKVEIPMKITRNKISIKTNKGSNGVVLF